VNTICFLSESRGKHECSGPPSLYLPRQLLRHKLAAPLVKRVNRIALLYKFEWNKLTSNDLLNQCVVHWVTSPRMQTFAGLAKAGRVRMVVGLHGAGRTKRSHVPRKGADFVIIEFLFFVLFVCSPINKLETAITSRDSNCASLLHTLFPVPAWQGGVGSR
jgi:hypothetical protein